MRRWLRILNQSGVRSPRQLRRGRRRRPRHGSGRWPPGASSPPASPASALNDAIRSRSSVERSSELRALPGGVVGQRTGIGGRWEPAAGRDPRRLERSNAFREPGLAGCLQVVDVEAAAELVLLALAAPSGWQRALERPEISSRSNRITAASRSRAAAAAGSSPGCDADRRSSPRRSCCVATSCDHLRSEADRRRRHRRTSPAASRGDGLATGPGQVLAPAAAPSYTTRTGTPTLWRSLLGTSWPSQREIPRERREHDLVDLAVSGGVRTAETGSRSPTSHRPRRAARRGARGSGRDGSVASPGLRPVPGHALAGRRSTAATT